MAKKPRFMNDINNGQVGDTQEISDIQQNDVSNSASTPSVSEEETSDMSQSVETTMPHTEPEETEVE